MLHKRNGWKKKNMCFWCIKAVKWIPVLFIMATTFWSYYAYVFELCLYTISSETQRTAYLVFYHFLFLIFYWTYLKTIFTNIGKVPNEFKLPESEYDRLMHADSEEMARNILESFAHDLPISNYTVNGAVRYCNKCRHIKPDRSHHCSVCGECVLKMDHHCPWINNCVSFTNYKFFILFLGYALIYCVYVSATTAEYFIGFWLGNMEVTGKFQVIFLFFVATTFAVSLISLFGYHCYLVVNNRTTLEAFRPAVFNTGPDKNGYNLGTYKNIQEVFGCNIKAWLIPVSTQLGNGIVFLKKNEGKGCYHSMNTTTVNMY